MVRALFVLWMLAFGSVVSSAQVQPDSVRSLPEVEVVDSLRARPTGGILVRYLEVSGMSAAGGRLDDLLGGGSSVHVRRSGTTGLSTASIRGAGSLRTTILLDGHRLSDPQTGTLDLSLIPGFLLSGVRVVHGPGLAGSSDGRSLGGAVELETMNAGDAPSGARLGVFGGAFGRWAGGAGLRHTKGRWAVAGAAQLETLRGDHPYLDDVSFPPIQRKREGAGRTSSSFLGTASFDGESLDIDLLALATRAHRGVPGPVNAPPIAARQRDKLDRVQATIRTGIPSGSLALRAAATGSVLRFDHPTFGVSTTRTRSWTGTLELKRAFPGSTLLSLSTGITLDRARAENAGVPGRVQADNVGAPDRDRSESAETMDRARAEDTSPAHSRRLVHFTAGLLVVKERWQASLGAALESVRFGERNVPRLTPAASFRFQTLPAQPVWLRTSASRVFRAPSLGELHTVPGGNPELRPEEGFSLDAGVEAALRLGRIQIRMDIGGFVNSLRNHVLWRPSFVGAGIHVWRPSNIARTAARGLEGGIRVTVIESGAARAPAGTRTAYYVPARNTPARNSPAQTTSTTPRTPIRLDITLSGSRIHSVDRTDPGLVSYGRQLRYTPRTILRMNASLESAPWRLEASVRKTGLQFTTSDESLHLDGHTTVDLSLERTFGDHLTIWLGARNVTNAHVEFIRFYPMPGRHLSAGLLLNTLR